MPPERQVTVTIGDRAVTRIGLGTNRLTDSEPNHRFLRSAVEAGLEFIDTAHLYRGGESERAIGAALAPFGEKLLVATKGGYRPGMGSPEALRAQVEESLERLRTERIDLYYLHRVDPQTRLEDSLGALAELRSAGLIGHVGLSEVTVEEIERAREIVPVAAVQNEYNLDERKHEPVLEHCEREGIAFVPFYPLGGGLDRAAEVAAAYGATPSQVALAWLLARSPAMAPIPGTLSLEHLRENLEALDLELSESDLAYLAG